MIDVKELLFRWAVGHKKRKIALATGADRETATRTIEVAEPMELPRDREQECRTGMDVLGILGALASSSG